MARPWRWSSHRATIPRHRGTGPEAYLFSTSQGSRPEDARLPAVQHGPPGAGMVCGAKRIRSLYLPSMKGVTPELSTTTTPKGLASLSTINAALCAFAEETSLPLLTDRGCPSAQLRVPSLSREKPLPQRSSSPSLQLGEKGGQIHGRSRWFAHNAG